MPSDPHMRPVPHKEAPTSPERLIVHSRTDDLRGRRSIAIRDPTRSVMSRAAGISDQAPKTEAA